MKAASEEGGLLRAVLIKGQSDPANGTSNREPFKHGRVQHPMDFNLLISLKGTNVHHCRCIKSKRNATVGFGFKAEEVETLLDPLTNDGIQSVLNAVAEDYYDTGNGYIEVVKRGGRVTGLHHLPAHSVYVYIEGQDKKGDPLEWHYEIEGTVEAGLFGTGVKKHFARWGEQQRVFEWIENKAGKAGVASGGQENRDKVSEVIHFKNPNNKTRWYGLPDWTAALPKIEIVQVADQFNYDFFQNWGSIAQIVAVTGESVDDDDWEELEKHFQKTVASGQGFKSLLINLPGKDVKIERIELGKNQFEGSFLEYERNQVIDILSAHSVPPMVAGVQPSAKLFFAKRDEVRDTVRLFQALEVGPHQKVFRKCLELTLGTVYNIPQQPKVKQEISGVSQTMEREIVSGWTLRKMEDEIDFDMTPQTGGPDDPNPNGVNEGRES